MEHELSDEVAEDLVTDNRYFAFADVLGYGGILFDGEATQHQRVRWLFDVWECLNGSLQEVRNRFPQTDAILFSDSIYFSSIDPIELAAVLGNLMWGVHAYYQEFPTKWVPWLRAGMSYGWGIDVNDPSLKGRLRDPLEGFRNPAGPGPAEAYYLAERCKFDGPRVLVPEFIKTQIVMGLTTQQWPKDSEFGALVEHWTRPWPKAGEVKVNPASQTDPVAVFDLPWWRCLPFGGTEAARRLEEHRWQVDLTGGAGAKHLEAGLRVVNEVE